VLGGDEAVRRLQGKARGATRGVESSVLSALSPGLRRALAGIAVGGAVVCATVFAVAVRSVGGHHRDLIAIFEPLIGAAFIGTGLLAWVRRPENPFGALMVAVGFSYCLSALIVATEPWPFILGLHLIALPYAILFHILLAFPSGHLETRADRLLAAAAYLVATVGWWVCMLFQDTAAQGFPANPLLVRDDPGLFDTLARARLVLVVVLIVLLGVVMVRRWMASSASQRGALAPVYLSGGLVLALYAVWSVLGTAGVAPRLQESLERARVIALAIVPFAFLLGLLRSRVATATAVSELVARLGGGRAHGALRTALADALGDPTLQVAYWLPARRQWVDDAGATFALPAAAAGRTSTPVEQDGEPVALLVHAAEDEPELVRAVGGAAALALENERLEAELRANVQELRASRARVVESADAARRRIERDLHDGAQQQLVALALMLQTARLELDRDPDRARDLLDDASHDLEAALRDLRELARGIHPAVLSDRGLASALQAAADRAPLPVEVVAAPDERLPGAVEAAAYFVVAEALTNVARYAHASHALVAVTREGHDLVVRVTDDGIGGADPTGGSGLRGLGDRVAALDGSLGVESPPGGGTTVRAVIPVPPASEPVAPPAPDAAASRHADASAT
jgi:signal transduction histidine kinase